MITDKWLSAMDNEKYRKVLRALAQSMEKLMHRDSR